MIGRVGMDWLRLFFGTPGTEWAKQEPIKKKREESDLPTFKIIALGAQESGKTVLLASMYHRLSTEIKGGGSRLQTDLGQAVELSNLYATLRDPNKDWPPGTQVGVPREFSFECVGSAEGAEFLRFTYLDYAGELISGGPAADPHQLEDYQQDLEDRSLAAHAIFGIVDGQRMIEFLQGDPSGIRYIEGLNPIIGVMRKVKCPVHFILTKWDLFDDVDGLKDIEENDRLAAISRKLLEQQSIRNLVEQSIRDKRIVRLIPVSAIGRKFATMDTEGHMIKLKDGRLQPINIEIPLCAVLPDLFTQIEAQLDQSTERKIAAKSRELSRLEPVKWASAGGKFLKSGPARALRFSVDTAIGLPLFSNQIADAFVDWVGSKQAPADGAVRNFHRRANEMRIARYEVLREFRENMIVLSRQLPASDLTDRSVR